MIDGNTVMKIVSETVTISFYESMRILGQLDVDRRLIEQVFVRYIAFFQWMIIDRVNNFMKHNWILDSLRKNYFDGNRWVLLDGITPSFQGLLSFRQNPKITPNYHKLTKLLGTIFQSTTYLLTIHFWYSRFH